MYTQNTYINYKYIYNTFIYFYNCLISNTLYVSENCTASIFALVYSSVEISNTSYAVFHKNGNFQHDNIFYIYNRTKSLLKAYRII